MNEFAKFMVKEISTQEFEKEVKQSKISIVIDYWASWCTPCKAFAPIFESVAKKLEGKIKFLKVNVDENNELSSSEGVMSIPTIIFYKNGEEIDRFIGSKSEKEFETFITKNFG